MTTIQFVERAAASNGLPYAELPRVTVDVTYSAPTGQTHNPNTSVELTTLLGGARNAQRMGAVFDNYDESISRSISRAFGLVMYYDGAVMHVYSARDMKAFRCCCRAVSPRIFAAALASRVRVAR